MSADIHRQRRRVVTPLTIPLTGCPRGHPNGDRSGDRFPVPNLVIVVMLCWRSARAVAAAGYPAAGCKLTKLTILDVEFVIFVSFAARALCLLR